MAKYTMSGKYMKVSEIDGSEADYPMFQTTSNSARFVMPFAMEYCKGVGVDVGAGNPKWALPGAQIVDPAINAYHAMQLPSGAFDYIFSSHCLEHLTTPWFVVLDYWQTKLTTHGLVFLYLPDYSQLHWRPWNNPKHKQIIMPEHVCDYFRAVWGARVTYQACDLNNSFTVIAET